MEGGGGGGGVGGGTREGEEGAGEAIRKQLSISILHTNPRGWISKQESVLKVVDLIKPTIVNINETQMNGNNKPLIKSY